MRPLDTEEPTHEEEVAAERLAEETKAQTARYVDYEAAIADGYVPDGPELGLQRHLKNPAYQKDGLILKPSKPELLVYATDGENQQLLGVAYTMERAGDPGPQIGGPLTRWHSHNICFTLLPPSFGLVSPFGTCPLGAVAVTLPEMMHVGPWRTLTAPTPRTSMTSGFGNCSAKALWLSRARTASRSSK